MDAYTLCSACKDGDLIVVQKALEMGIDPNEPAFTGILPLCAAARSGATEIITLLLGAGADVNKSEQPGMGEKGHLPLGAAAIHGQTEAMECLLAAGANIDGMSQKNESALFLAASEGQTKALRTLLNGGANVDLANGYRARRALHEACAWFKVETVDQLLKAGASVDCLDDDKCTPLHLVCHPELSKGAAVQLITRLLDRGAEVNVIDKFNRTPLSEAAKWLTYDAVILLIKSGARVSYRDDEGNTPLIGACHHNKDWRVAKLLIDSGASVADLDKDGKTALHHAAVEDVSDKTVELLLSAGADVDLEDQKGRTPLALAISSIHQDKPSQRRKMALLLDKSAHIPPTALFDGARNGNIELCRGLFKKGMNANPRDIWQRTPLHWAAFEGQMETLRLLIESGANLSIEDDRGNTPLHLSCRQSHIEVVKELLDSGAPTDRKNIKGRTPLYYLDEESRTKLFASHKELEKCMSTVESALPKSLRCKKKAEDETRYCSECGWQGTADEKDRLHCPWCCHLSVSECNYEVLHGNPSSPAADTEVRFEYECEHCAAKFSSNSNVFGRSCTSIFSLDVSSSFFSEDGGKSWKRSWDWDD